MDINKKQSLISVIIPIFNTEQFLDRCIQSVINQTYTNLDIILVNDGSKDNSLSICMRYADIDKRITILNQENLGASIARNRGIDNAHGNFVMFVDSDDFIETDIIESLFNVQKKTNCDIVISKIPGDLQVYLGDKELANIDVLKAILKGGWWSPCGKLIKKDILKGVYFPSKTISEDYVFMVLLMFQCKRILYINKCFYHREKRENSLSNMNLCYKRFDELYNVKYVYELITQDIPSLKKLAQKNLVGTILQLLQTIYKTDNKDEFLSFRDEMISIIRKDYWSIIFNSEILWKQRILISLCYNKLLGRIALQNI